MGAAGGEERVAQHERRGTAVGRVLRAPPVSASMAAQAEAEGGLHVPHPRPAPAGAALGAVLLRRRQGAVLRLRPRHAGLPPGLPAVVAVPPPPGAQQGTARHATSRHILAFVIKVRFFLLPFGCFGLVRRLNEAQPSDNRNQTVRIDDVRPTVLYALARTTPDKRR